MKKGFLIASALMILLMPGIAGCSRGYSGPPQPLSIGTTTSEVNSLILIAEGQGFFDDNGIDFTHTIYPSGVAALNGLLGGEVDLATGSEFAFAGQVLAGQDVRALASVCRSSIEYLVVRGDRGIGSPADLKGKIIGVPLGSRPEFSIDRYLMLNGISPDDVTLVNVPVSQSVETLAAGTVDAVTTWQPYVDRIKEQMPGNWLAWSTQQEQQSYTLAMCTAEWAQNNPALASRFIRALSQAQDYMLRHPDDAKTYIREKMGYEQAYVDSVWDDYRFDLSLDQALVTAMEDQARWLIAGGLTPAANVPDFTGYIYQDALKSVKPAAVKIIG